MNDIAEHACSARSPTDNATSVTKPSPGARIVVCDNSQLAFSKLRLGLRDRGVDAADLGIHRELGALLRGLGRVELRQRRLVLILVVLRLELCVGAFCG